MEKVLHKLARQLNAFDEASLMALWEKYAQQVQQFEPTKRWEEAVLIFGLIQALHLKNQLFNYNWAQTARPLGVKPRLGISESVFENDLLHLSGNRSGSGGNDPAGEGISTEGVKQRAKVLRFRPRETDDSV